jgi:hypothetical protein
VIMRVVSLSLTNKHASIVLRLELITMDVQLRVYTSSECTECN